MCIPPSLASSSLNADDGSNVLCTKSINCFIWSLDLNAKESKSTLSDSVCVSRSRLSTIFVLVFSFVLISSTSLSEHTTDTIALDFKLSSWSKS